MNIQYNTFKQDSTWVTASVQPVIDAIKLTGEIINCELHTDNLSRLLDRFCGLDWILKTPEEQILGIAFRVQKVASPKKAWDTFTLRFKRSSGVKTEFEKRKEAIDKGYFYPYWTIQAYVDSQDVSKVYSCAIVKTKDLYDYCTNYSYEVETQESDNIFKVVHWDKLEKRNYNITSSYFTYNNN